MKIKNNKTEFTIQSRHSPILEVLYIDILKTVDSWVVALSR